MMELLTFLSPAKDTLIRVVSKEGMYTPDSRMYHPIHFAVLSREALIQVTTLNQMLLSASSNRSGLTVKLSTYGMDRSTQARTQTEKKELVDRPYKPQVGFQQYTL